MPVYKIIGVSVNLGTWLCNASFPDYTFHLDNNHLALYTLV